MKWTITGSGWILGTATISDDGGNYNSAGFSPNFSINSKVTAGTTPLREEGTITIQQVFLLTTYIGSYPTLSYTTRQTANAGTSALDQHAEASCDESWSQQNQSYSSGLGAAAAGINGSDADDNTTSADLEDWNTGFTITSHIHALAWQLGQEGGGGAGGGLCYKPASLIRKIKTLQVSHVPGRRRAR